MLQRLDDRRQVRHATILISSYVVADLQDIRHTSSWPEGFDTLPFDDAINIDAVKRNFVADPIRRNRAVVIDLYARDNAIAIVCIAHLDRRDAIWGRIAREQRIAHTICLEYL